MTTGFSNFTQAATPLIDYLLTAPVQYISGPNTLNDCGRFIIKWGQNVLVSGGKKALKSVESKLFSALEDADIKYEVNQFTGECSEENITVLVEKVQRMALDAIIGVGGGKSLDTAKRAAEICNVPVICIPTIAATCAAASAVSVIYTEKGVHKKDYNLEKSPNLVLVDTEIIANSPVDYIESGILDSLSKWYEGKAVFKGISNPDIFTISALNLAELLNEIMEKEAVNAVQAVKCRKVTSSVAQITDLNIYLAAVIQSIGKKTRGAAAHAIHAGLSVIPQSHSILHGYKVGYGMVAQLFMEKTDLAEIKQVVKFFRQLDLESSFKGLCLPFEDDLLRKVAEKATLSEPMKNMPFKVLPEQVITAMKQVEEVVCRI
ncbi:MAG: iron-containing alcohol dehydrogenase family protein [Bacillota bacterium]